MKNVHVLPTDKPSRLQLQMNGKYDLENGQIIALKSFQNIYITNDEEIKEEDWFISDFNSFPIHNIKELSEREGTLGWEQKDLKNNLKIILTTDQDLIKDGVQAIDDEFLEWFVNNPSCEWVELDIETELDAYYRNGIGGARPIKIIIPKEKPKQGTPEEVAEIILANNIDGLRDALKDDDLFYFYKGVIQL
jgi:hypothetical protein